MAIGYSKLISSYDDVLLRSFVTFLLAFFEKENYVLLTMYVEGEEVAVSDDECIIQLLKQNALWMKIESPYKHGIFLTIEIVNRHLITEDYSLDELLKDVEYDNLYQVLLKRFNVLKNEGCGIGFIFDRGGYSEDYIQIKEI